MSEDPTTLILYDIQLDPTYPPRAPNPWKARFALNYTRKCYKTHWVPFLQVGPTRRKLGVPSVRKHADGSDFPTLPILQDPSTNLLVGDSFDIALHLHNISPSTPLFPPQSIALHRTFNAYVDQLFSFRGGAQLAGYYQRFDPKTEADDKGEFLRRIPGLRSWEDLHVPVGSAARLKIVADFKEALGSGLAVWFVNRDKGPFIEGATPMFADFIIGGWLMFMRWAPEWEEMKTWHDGVWGRLSDALEQWGQIV